MKSVNGKATFWAVIAIISIVLNGYFFGAHLKTGKAATTQASASQTESTYVCPMHPQVVQDHPGDCPICGMKLVKKSASVDGDAALDSIIGSVKLSPTQEALANVTVEHPVFASFEGSISIPGTIAEREEDRWKASVKTMGRIEKLYVGTTGQIVKEGDPLFDLFSPEMTSAGNELVRANETGQDDGGLSVAARAKLLALGAEPAHLMEIDAKGEVPELFTFHALKDGVLMEKMASEGEWVMPGMAALEFSNFADVWVEGTLLEKDAGRLHVGASVEVVNLAGDRAEATVSLVGPMLDMMAHTLPFRALLKNSGSVWRLGMFVTVNLREGGKFETLSLPEDAVLHTGRGTVVWLKIGEGRFVPRNVVTGPHQNGRVAIMSGLEPTDAVAVTGGYLIDSDAQLSNIQAPQESEISMPKTNGNTLSVAGNSAYTCPMHPEVVSDKPGKCPKCGMFLEKKDAGK